MKNDKDRRYRRTERLLRESLVTLILEKGYANVSVRDIAERADIAYATFFRHYPSKEDLLLDYLQEHVHDLEQIAHQHMAGRDQGYFQIEGELAFRYAQQKAHLFSAIFESRRTLRRFTDLLAGHILKLARPQLDHTPFPAEIVANHVAASILALIEWWMLHGMPYSPEQMGLIYEKLIIESALGKPQS